MNHDYYLYDNLIKYSNSDMYPFHMPGHKRNRALNDPSFQLDVTEVPPFDDLHHPSNIVSGFSKDDGSFLLVNGSTGGILAAIRTLTNPGDTVLIARNCHRSVYNALEVFGLEPRYIMPEAAYDGEEEQNFYGKIHPAEVERMLKEYPKTSLVVITSPTYEGMCSDTETIADICHAHGARLFVDQAHGVHPTISMVFSTTNKLFFSPPAQKADIYVTSLHKNLPALTQCAMLYSNLDREMTAELRTNLAVFQTSSPSYILMASVESCLNSINNSKAFFEYWQRLQRFYDEADETINIEVLFRKKQCIHDSGKILLSSAKTDINGFELARLLREKYLIETEMAAPDYALAYSTFADTDEGFRRLINALKQIDSQCGRIEGAPDTAFISELPQQAFIPSEKYNYNIRTVPLSKSKGSAAAETVVAYPPGSPCVAAGEVITGEIIEYIKQIKSMGGELIYDSYSHDSEMINVAEL